MITKPNQEKDNPKESYIFKLQNLPFCFLPPLQQLIYYLNWDTKVVKKANEIEQKLFIILNSVT